MLSAYVHSWGLAVVPIRDSISRYDCGMSITDLRAARDLLAKAVAAVRQLIELKRQGLPIANTVKQLEVMIPYFRDPESLQAVVQCHIAHEKNVACAALTHLQIQSDGDVKVCWSMEPIGNIKTDSIRKVWEVRPRWWESGCCLECRTTNAEKTTTGLLVST